MSKRTASRQAARRGITPDDLLRFRLVSSPQISPDGSRIVFVEKHVGEKNEYVTNLWMVDSGGGTPRQFTSGGKDSQPRWSPDGTRIAFVAARQKRKPQVHLIDCGGGEAVALTKFPEGSVGQIRWAPSGSLLAVSFRETDPEWTEEAEKQRAERGASTPPRVLDDWWYRLDGDGYFNAQRYQLYLIDVPSGERRHVELKDTLGSFRLDFSPDSKQLVVSVNRDKKALVRPWKDELLRVDVASGKTTAIPNLPQGPKTHARWSPDGRTIAYAGREGKAGLYDTQNLELYICDPVKGHARSLTADHDYCLMAPAIADTSEVGFAPAFTFDPQGTRIYMRLGVKGEVHIGSIPVAGGRLELTTSGELDQDLGNLSADGKRLALTAGTATKLAEVAVAEIDAKGRFHTRAVTDLNGPLLKELDLVQPTSHWITAADGHRVHVWVIKPRGDGHKGRLPAVLEIHGGPHGQYGSGFFHEFQVLAAQGYAVFYSNPRGSKGYGRDHCSPIRGKWGTADWIDIQAVTRFMKEQPYVDSARMGVMGGSYGGYMTNWVIGHCHDFAGAITDRCVSNMVSMGGTSDYVDAPDDYFPGNFWDRPEARWEQSPLKYLGNAKTPTLIIHSEGDLRCNIEQAEQVFAALKLNNVPTRFIRYPATTSHGMSRGGPPDLRIHRLNQILAWWKKYLA